MNKHLCFSLAFSILLLSGCTSKSIDTPHNKNNLIIKDFEVNQNSFHTTEKKKLQDLKDTTTSKIQKKIVAKSIKNKKELQPLNTNNVVTVEKKSESKNKQEVIKNNVKIISQANDERVLYTIKTDKPLVKVTNKKKHMQENNLNLASKERSKPQVLKIDKEEAKILKKNSKVLESKSQNRKAPYIPSQEKRVQEIMSRLNSYREPKDKITHSQVAIEKQKDLRVQELIKQMNGMKNSKEEDYKTIKVIPVDINKTRANLKKKIEELPKIEMLNKEKISPTVNERKVKLPKKKEEDLYRVRKVIGDKVCRDARGLINFVCMDFIAYVKDVNKNKIKVKVIESKCENSKYNGIGLYKNTVLWDDYYNWKLCK